LSRRGIFSTVFLVVVCHATAIFAADSQWVRTGATGRLIYAPDAQGDRILDFTNVGYKGHGSELLPNDIPTVITVAPVAGDDTATIQAAINQLAAMPIQANGYRGAVLLQAGQYDINTQLNINASGIVLRGVGRDIDGTVLHARGTSQRPLVNIIGSGSQSLTGSTYNMVDKAVPAGTNSFRLDSVVWP
jgi:pectin methylesterase-like acyl-CoA thioesterase